MKIRIKFNTLIGLYLGYWSDAAQKMLYDQEDYDLRTAQSFIDYGLLGTKTKPVNGIFGPSLISKEVSLNVTPIDYMHLICLGIFKHILSIFLDSKNHTEPYYIGKFLKLVKINSKHTI